VPDLERSEESDDGAFEHVLVVEEDGASDAAKSTLYARRQRYGTSVGERPGVCCLLHIRERNWCRDGSGEKQLADMCS
jgi:hypothetical protein